ncbi:CDP-diacylglycerol--glycerol-3-phosphate 3-phosphatidyltransferase [Candidatus Vallotiella sp. (ex Adelges kitamiensis)]|uniref:CDP-diacylglycerol--glycerol-3-phosphate 3-phosphatidyltransferase n=1 Tax=Candidatus Vallotiella sp. (ex Adelges kitamiensis) TaxID=2864217 RepID=UPI001CE2E1F4|nr:CDP-diacylglycerol--glycerol-3-phosphate 3-phosphatidyltransferase [Candidatus Vallotia sp. (ex Adelges kitamiensis)]
MPLNLPIFLTWLRIVLIPLIVGIYYLPNIICTLQNKNKIAAAIFTLAALTDWFDGFLARKLNQTSVFGAFLDPVADKLMVTATLLILVQLFRLDAAVALVIVGREIAISALREWMAHVGASERVAVNFLGKFKTVCQMIAIPMLLYYAPISILGWFAVNTRVLGAMLLYLAALLTICSMLYYMKLAWPQIRDRTSC